MPLIDMSRPLRVASSSDWVIDIGPGAGEDGGKIVVEGPPQRIAKHAASRTAGYLREALSSGRAN